MTLIGLIIILIAVLVSFIAGWVLNSLIGKKSLATAKVKVESLLQDAKSDADALKKEKILEVEDELYQQRQTLEDEFKKKKETILKTEKELADKDSNIDRKADLVAKKESELHMIERDLIGKENSLSQRQQSLEESIVEANKKLEDLSGITQAEAKQLLMDNLLDEAKVEAAHTVHQIVTDAESNAKEEARRILVTTMEQVVTNHTIESTVSSVHLPSDDMKGRIIGKEGRNIRAFEVVTRRQGYSA